MGARKKKLPFGTPGEWIQLSSDDWKAIMAASGIEVKGVAFAQIKVATMALSHVGGAEHSAPSTAALKRIKKLAAMVRRLRREFPSENTEDVFKHFEGHFSYVMQTERQREVFGPSFHLDVFSHLLTYLERVTRVIIRDVHPHGESVNEKGSFWELWIVLLTNIFDNAGLPTQVRKDHHDLGEVSPFVIFVRELQARLPQHLSADRKNDALATAIIRARRGSELSKLNNVMIEEILKQLLGAYKMVFGEDGFLHHNEVNVVADAYVSALLLPDDE
jgi:hypothetical protein